MRWFRSGISALVLLLFVQGAQAGKLKDFAQKATGTPDPEAPAPPPPPPTPPPQTTTAPERADRSSFGSGTYPSDSGSSWGEMLFWLLTAPFNSNNSGNSDDPFAAEDRTRYPIHVSGEATAPYLRLDYAWQYVDSDIDAHDLKLEAGYKPFALHVRHSHYKDRSDGFLMDINQYYGVLRYGGYVPDSIPGSFEIGIGFGAAQIDTNDAGIEEHTRGAITVPLKYYPVDWAGVEFRPAWYKWNDEAGVIGDYDFSIALGYRFVMLRGGYRWLWLQGEGTFNDGFYVGTSVSF